MILLSPITMHIPDGFLSVMVAILYWLVSIAFIALALRRANTDLGEKDVPLMGVLAAAIFAGQMINFAVTGGTSGHLLGAALVAVLLGPWAAVLVMTAVVSVQALIFQDGGLVALGANLFNMAVIGVLVAHAIYRLVLKLSGGKRWGVLAGSFAAAWGSIFFAALSCALQLALSGVSPANIVFPAMAAIHALIGLGEGLITLGAISFLYAVRRDLLHLGQPGPAGSKAILLGGGILILLLTVISPLASANPDGLAWVAEQQGFFNIARESFYTLIPGYAMPGVENKAAATMIAGLVGALIVLGVTLAIGYARRRKQTSKK